MPVGGGFRGFLLDADNTLFDFDRAETDALLATVRVPQTRADELLREYRRINTDLWVEAEAGRISFEGLAVERFSRLCASLGLDADPRELSRRYLQDLGGRAYLMPGALPVLDRLSRRAVLGLLSNGIPSVLRGRLARSGIDIFFHGVFI